MSEAFMPRLRFDKEQNYKEFEMLHGFDIRIQRQPDTLVSQTRDRRDLRDQHALGRSLLARPDNMTILEMAALIEETR